MIQAISPIDGRYASKTGALSEYFSEYALIRERVGVEIAYFIALTQIPLPQLQGFPSEKTSSLKQLVQDFTTMDAEKIKEIEATTNHDVKAVEYWIKSKFDDLNLSPYKEFIHFGLTSQDINNTANPILLKNGIEQILLPGYRAVSKELQELASAWKDIPMLARTHGQPASPTRLGKEINVYVERLYSQILQLASARHSGKFGGATGNLNAHYVSYPDIDWHGFASTFLAEKLGLTRQYPTTQIEHYDDLASICHNICRINTILLDLCRDIWTYVSMDYFRQKVVKGEVGSSAMPHKVNPIDFENAEGNLGLANAILEHLAAKLPISRLQRDLTDSTVLRNMGMPLAHSLIAIQSIIKGLGKLTVREEIFARDLDSNWAVIAEAIQNILRREGYPSPYEALKELTRTGEAEGITQESIHLFISTLDIEDRVRRELLAITPHNYLGK